MKRNDEKIHDDRWLKDLPVHSEKPAFESNEMIVCASCGRANAPTRVKCLYCGGELPVSETNEKTGEAEKIALRKPENWEKGFNLIYLESSGRETSYSEIAALVELEYGTVKEIIESGKKLPILRAESEREALEIKEKLRNSGIETKIVSDESLAPEKLPQRLRGLCLKDEKVKLVLFNLGETVGISSDDLVLIVKGAIFERQTESVEKRKKTEIKIVESTETSSDENLIDIYSRQDPKGYRISTKGFDFSGLESEKGLLANDNLKKLVLKLQNFAPNAKLVDDYSQLRKILGSVWEVDNRRETKGLKRHSFSKFDFAKVESSSNLQQLTKYSRLQWQLL